jgi:malonyl-CoA/methylmalonyl-CoA synthetase
MILFTSGTTGRPKGVVTTHANISAQIESLVEAWEWSEDDRILLTLPLHHVHGIVNVVGCALWSGARCDMLTGFDALMWWTVRRWRPFLHGCAHHSRLIRLLQEARGKGRFKAGSRSRLMVAARPHPVPSWSAGASCPGTPFERYGIEIGWVCLYRGAIPGRSGRRLVEARLVDERDELARAVEIQVVA